MISSVWNISTAFAGTLMCAGREQPTRREKRIGIRGGLKSEKESDGGLCEVGHFVHVQCGRVKVGGFVYETPIFRPHTKVASETVLEPAAVQECGFGLPVDTRIHALGVVGWIEYQGSSTEEPVRSYVGKMRGRCITNAPVTS